MNGYREIKELCVMAFKSAVRCALGGALLLGLGCVVRTPAQPTTYVAYVEPPPPAPTPAYVPEIPPELTAESREPYVVEADDDADPNFFYEALEPHGTWIEVESRLVWQPAVAVADPQWRPYCDNGYWVHADCGWTWYSHYVWGWAPFHYGRWTHHPRHGWIWLPGRMWAPAWVAWRCSDHHFGWAPLPPRFAWWAHGAPGMGPDCFVFVPSRHFLAPRLRPYCVARPEVTVVYSSTTVIENNYIVNRNTIIHRGPDRARVARATGEDVKEHRVVDADRSSGVFAGARELSQRLSSGTLSVYRPKVGAASPASLESMRSAIARKTAEKKSGAAVPVRSSASLEARTETRSSKESPREAAPLSSLRSSVTSVARPSEKAQETSVRPSSAGKRNAPESAAPLAAVKAPVTRSTEVPASTSGASGTLRSAAARVSAQAQNAPVAKNAPATRIAPAPKNPPAASNDRAGKVVKAAPQKSETLQKTQSAPLADARGKAPVARSAEAPRSTSGTLRSTATRAAAQAKSASAPKNAPAPRNDRAENDAKAARKTK